MAVSYSYAFPSQTNTFLPQAMENLLVNFARNPKKFIVNQLATTTPVNAVAGAWPRLNPSDVSRVVKNPNQFLWPDGSPRPAEANNKQGVTWVDYRCLRRVVDDYAGYVEKENASFDLEMSKFAVLGQKAMTARTLAFYNVAFDTSLNLASHVQTATAWGGGKWDVATGTNNYIQKTFQAVANRIILDTAGVVEQDAITCVISPYVAYKMAASQEVRDFLAQAPASPAFLRGDKEYGLNSAFGLPDQMYGIKIMVDKTVQNDVVYGASDSIDYAIGSSALFIARPGEMVNTGALESQFSAIHFVVYRGNEMVTTTWDDAYNKRFVYSVEDFYDCKMVAPEACCVATSVVD